MLAVPAYNLLADVSDSVELDPEFLLMFARDDTGAPTVFLSISGFMLNFMLKLLLLMSMSQIDVGGTIAVDMFLTFV